MHKLFAHNLNTETNLDVFFLKYLGAEVLEKLNNSIVNFSEKAGDGLLLKTYLQQEMIKRGILIEKFF